MFMKRKVNKVGQNTLTVSLPSKWVKKLNIKPGDELELA
ncbi:MAG: AbrB/MazE/SpoVT family DNA-binding domain-containing protein, partial [Nanoarchaeota archaeon]|nr:AbrB/MazE/SpoVT family DNA-binding domain-containing protein [Nanoarchaeota archaeon]